jgi:hypothetical protein
MKIYLRRNSPELSRKEAKYAINYISSLLMSRQLCNNLILHIEFIGAFDDDFKRYDQGDCIWLDDNDSPREFHIRLNSTLSREDLLSTLAHELVHVKQWALNEKKNLARYPAYIVKWKKRIVNEYNFQTTHDFPWEKEAYRKEPRLYQSYCEHLINNNIHDF